MQLRLTGFIQIKSRHDVTEEISRGGASRYTGVSEYSLAIIRLVLAEASWHCVAFEGNLG